MEEEDTTIAAFVHATGCSFEEAFERLASCGGHLGRATIIFHNVDAGPSGTRPSPPPSPSPSQQATDDDDAGVRGRSPSGSSSATASRRAQQRPPQDGHHRNSDGDGREPSRTRRRRFHENISSDSEEEEEEAERGRNRNSRRRRLLSRDEEFDYLKDLEELDLHDSPPRAGPPINSKASAAAERHELAHKGGFHDAKVRAARERQWLLVNVRGSYDLASFQQTCVVWDADVVARCVRDRFVLWQADAHAGGGEGEEAQKVLCYYGLPRDRIPAVVVDPVTGQALEKLHGSDACDLNDFLLRVGALHGHAAGHTCQSHQGLQRTTSCRLRAEQQSTGGSYYFSGVLVQACGTCIVGGEKSGRAACSGCRTYRSAAADVVRGGEQGLQAQGPTARWPGGHEGVRRPVRRG
ncbi:hypothetical protein BS78_02G076200 [Paspalum vaginatum]|nr:hypothetical protein BS78_02G076200 [Paspalum vaginatum]